jgi:hypothetical protein
MDVPSKRLFTPMHSTNERWPVGEIEQGGIGSRVHHALIEQGTLDLVHVQADEIRVKGRSLIAWMGLSMMVSTRLWLGGVVSRTRDTALTDRMMRQVRACSQGACALLVCTDGWAAYVRRFGVCEILPRGE